MEPSIKKINKLQDLPNVGPAIAAKLRTLGIDKPSDLQGQNPYAMYDELNSRTGKRHDPCLLDVFISVVRFMEGTPAKPWWKYTAVRKQRLRANGECRFRGNGLNQSETEWGKTPLATKKLGPNSKPQLFYL